MPHSDHDFVPGPPDVAAGDRPDLQTDLRSPQNASLDSPVPHLLLFPLAPNASFDCASTLSTTSAGDEKFADIGLLGVGPKSCEEAYFIARLDTQASVCIIAEGVVESRFGGIEAVDTKKRVVLTGIGTEIGANGVLTLGQIKIYFHTLPGTKWFPVPFQVVPDSVVCFKYDAILSGKFIKRNGVLVTDDKWQYATREQK